MERWAAVGIMMKTMQRGENIDQGRRTPINATSRVRWVHFAAPLHKIVRQWKMEEPAGFTWMTRTASLRERIRKRRGGRYPTKSKIIQVVVARLRRKRVLGVEEPNRTTVIKGAGE
jgi:hypothetical protein